MIVCANRPFGLHSVTRLIPVVALLAGCSDCLSPEDLVGEYSLVGFAGGTPPAIIHSQGGCTTRLDGGTLTIGNQGVIEIVLDEFIDCSAVGGPANEQGFTLTGTYEVDERTLDIVFYTDADGTIMTHGEVSEDTIAVPLGLEVDPLIFER